MGVWHRGPLANGNLPGGKRKTHISLCLPLSRLHHHTFRAGNSRAKPTRSAANLSLYFPQLSSYSLPRNIKATVNKICIYLNPHTRTPLPIFLISSVSLHMMRIQMKCECTCVFIDALSMSDFIHLSSKAPWVIESRYIILLLWYALEQTMLSLSLSSFTHTFRVCTRWCQT